MYLLKRGYPEEGEIVLCTVTKIHFHSVFVSLDEYKSSGMIHISEISPGRIRNLRDYVTEGKVIVCKVLRIDKEKGHIDLSLRRVSESVRRNKINEIKQGQIAEKIIDYVAKNLKIEPRKLFEDIQNKIKKDYSSLYECFEDVVAEEFSLDSLGLDKKTVKELDEIIKQRIKPKEVEIKGILKLRSYEPDGVTIIKDALQKTQKAGNEDSVISFMGAGKFKVSVKAPEYKEAEKILKDMLDVCEKQMEGKGEFSFEREGK